MFCNHYLLRFYGSAWLMVTISPAKVIIPKGGGSVELIAKNRGKSAFRFEAETTDTRDWTLTPKVGVIEAGESIKLTITCHQVIKNVSPVKAIEIRLVYTEIGPLTANPTADVPSNKLVELVIPCSLA